MTLKIKKFIKKHGELFAVDRSGQISKAEGLARDDESPPYVAFEPGTNIQAGDELHGNVSGNVYRVARVDQDIAFGRPFQLRAFIEQHPAETPGGIHIGSMVNSAIQQNSPGAIQTITVSNEYRAAALAVVGEIESVMPQLDLSNEDNNELSAELDTIRAQLKLSKPKLTVVRECFGNVKSILETAAATGGTWTLINDFIPRIVSLLS
jgi:hypothetical protein